MDFNAIGPANTSPEPASPRPPTDATGFEQQLRGAQAGAVPQRASSPVPQGDAYSPYLDAGHPYSPYLDAEHPYSPYLDLAHSLSPDQAWENDPDTPTAVQEGLEPEGRPRHLSQQAIAQAIEAHPGIDQDLIWRNLDPDPSHAGPSKAGPSHADLPRALPLQAGPSRAGPSEAAPPELSEFRMLDGRLAKDYWVFTGQTATGAQIDMLERSGVKPSKDHPTVFTLLGVPHTAEWREEDFIRITPSLNSILWPEDPGEDQPADSAEDPPTR
ncbi:hypothetical protein H8A97_32495 [Bradyrhizobium sp. Arg62]|uniref:hypothetical protein n=1 Tax=Bradyrhizobium TaxID=374 RepID=UPI001E407CAA|nr:MULTISPECIES: hypothetical protein [Bradyrhizobium]MCC8939909.1 hypothetical protein [Bradyrhizobium ivorense]MCC8949690.1 hypothetical protein [Bradyrhizobium brasilense]